MKIKSVLKILLLSPIICGLVLLAGCEKVDIEPHTQELKAELAEVKSLLADAQVQRDELKVTLEVLTKTVSDSKAQIEVLKQHTENAKQAQLQLDEIARQRDQAIASANEAQQMIDQLKNQLNDLGKQVADLQVTNKKLQDRIAKPEPQPEKEDVAKVGFPDLTVYE